MPDFAGSLFSNAGVARDTGADTVAIFTDATEATDTTGTGSATALTQTDSAGDWSSLSVADGIYDVRITDGSSVRWRRYNDRIQLREIWVGELSVVNQTNAVSNQILLLRGNNSTRAANDEIYVSMSMEDSGGGETEFARITAVGTTGTATSEAGRIDFAVMTAGTLADELQLTGTALAPSANDGLALGTSSLGFADLFTASGAVVNFDNGNMTLTHAAGTLTLAGGAYIFNTGIVYVNDTANANMTQGLTINQGAADNEILTLKSSDVVHGMTLRTEADTYGLFQKFSALVGCLSVEGYNDSGNRALWLYGRTTGEDATRSTLGQGAVTIDGEVQSGTSTAGMTADRNICVIGTAGTTRFIFDSDGDSHQDVGTAWTNFDEYDDLALMRAVQVGVTRAADPLRQQFLGQIEQSRNWLQSLPGKPIVTFNEDGHHFVNTSRLAMLHHGAIMQLGNYYQSHEERLNDLEAKNKALHQEVRALRRG